MFEAGRGQRVPRDCPACGESANTSLAESVDTSSVSLTRPVILSQLHGVLELGPGSWQ